MTQYGFYIDSSRCTGCKTCELACKDYNDLGPDIAFRKVMDFEGGMWTSDANGCWTTDTFGYALSDGCNHCDNPACVEICPTGSLIKDEETGFVGVDTATCIGCGSCTTACPYGAPKLDEAASVCVKCDGCKERVLAGGHPICVDACPVRALDFGTIDELRAAYGDLSDLAPLADSAMTGPNLVIKPPTAADSPSIDTGFLANPLEVA